MCECEGYRKPHPPPRPCNDKINQLTRMQLVGILFTHLQYTLSIRTSRVLWNNTIKHTNTHIYLLHTHDYTIIIRVKSCVYRQHEWTQLVKDQTHKEYIMIECDGSKESPEWSTPESELSNITQIRALRQGEDQLLSTVSTSVRETAIRATVETERI